MKFSQVMHLTNEISLFNLFMLPVCAFYDSYLLTKLYDRDWDESFSVSQPIPIIICRVC